MFRRIYWVTEFVEEDGTSRIFGVYTSIPDLIRHGIGVPAHALRITLTKLDSEKGPFGTWMGPNFEGLEAACQQFVQTDEFSIDEVKNMMNALRERTGAAA